MITREQIKLIAGLSPDDIEEQDSLSLYDIIQKLCSESLYMIDKIESQNELLEQFDYIMKQLNKENKKLYKQINNSK